MEHDGNRVARRKINFSDNDIADANRETGHLSPSLGITAVHDR